MASRLARRADAKQKGGTVWPHAATSAIGFWLLASPDLLQDAGTARMNNQIMGAWIVTFGLIAAS